MRRDSCPTLDSEVARTDFSSDRIHKSSMYRKRLEFRSMETMRRRFSPVRFAVVRGGGGAGASAAERRNREKHDVAGSSVGLTSGIALALQCTTSSTMARSLYSSSAKMASPRSDGTYHVTLRTELKKTRLCPRFSGPGLPECSTMCSASLVSAKYSGVFPLSFFASGPSGV